MLLLGPLPKPLWILYGLTQRSFGGWSVVGFRWWRTCTLSRGHWHFWLTGLFGSWFDLSECVLCARFWSCEVSSQTRSAACPNNIFGFVIDHYAMRLLFKQRHGIDHYGNRHAAIHLRNHRSGWSNCV